MSGNPLPDEIYLGKQSNEWPVHAFEREGSLVAWLGDRNANMPYGSSVTRRAWRCRIEVIEEVGLTQPSPARLEPKPPS